MAATGLALALPTILPYINNRLNIDFFLYLFSTFQLFGPSAFAVMLMDSKKVYFIVRRTDEAYFRDTDFEYNTLEPRPSTSTRLQPASRDVHINIDSSTSPNRLDIQPIPASTRPQPPTEHVN